MSSGLTGLKLKEQMKTSRTMYFNRKKIHIVEIITSGERTVVYKTKCGRVIKKYKKRERWQFEREVFWLEKLGGTGIVPELIDFDRKEKALLMEDAGYPITKVSSPDNWRCQLVEILDILKKFNCRHNDLSEMEILVKEDRIRIIDFGFATLGPDLSCGGRFPVFTKNRLVDDRFIINLMELIIGDGFREAEPHCFVLWDPKEKETVEQYIGSHFTVVYAATYHPRSFKIIGENRLSVLDRFYLGKPSTHGNKGISPFTLYVTFDKKPRYGIRNNPFSGKASIVNTNTFDLKNSLRRGRTSFLHCSDTIQEAYDNLEALSFYKHNVPVCYWEKWRPSFSSYEDFFNVLNNEQELKYVVLRNFEEFPEKFDHKSSDIDILVNDFYLFKRITGAVGYKHKLPKDHPSMGPAYEYGGYKVAAKVLIGGNEVTLDIRFIGDGYYDVEWGKQILKNRVKWKNFYVPGKTDLLYSFLYHILVHKREVTKENRIRVKKMAGIVVRAEEKRYRDEDLWCMLDKYMETRQYNYVRPEELNIPFNARERAGISIESDLEKAHEFFLSDNFLEARHLLRQVLADDPKNKAAKVLLKKTERKIYIKNSVLFILFRKLLRKLKVYFGKFRMLKYLKNRILGKRTVQ